MLGETTSTDANSFWIQSRVVGLGNGSFINTGINTSLPPERLIRSIYGTFGVFFILNNSSPLSTLLHSYSLPVSSIKLPTTNVSGLTWGGVIFKRDFSSSMQVSSSY